MIESRRLALLRIGIALTLLLSAAGLYAFAWPVYANNPRVLYSTRWQVVFGLGAAVLLVELGLLIAAWTPAGKFLLRRLDCLLDHMSRLPRAVTLALFALALAADAALVLGPFGGYLADFLSRLWLFWLVTLAGWLCLTAAGLKRPWLETLAASALISGAGFKALSFLTNISTYPLSLDWSEGSRFYYASLWFGQRLYGVPTLPTVLHPSRYLLMGAPYLIPGTPLWLHRAWQVFLWVGITALCAALLARRMHIGDRLRFWLAAAWAFLFLLLGPVYYHLQVPVIIVLWGFSGKPTTGGRFWKDLLVVLAASAWAGISRVNWFPVPGMLAVLLYLLEQPAGQRSWNLGGLFHYLWRPAIWALAGVAAAFGTQRLYIRWSGNPAELFSSSFSSDLLWYRLFPNPTFSVGILPSIVIVSLPLALVIAGRLHARWRDIHPIRWLGAGAILLVLLGGGLVVSTKIGGGNNLHNLDAYLVLLMVAAMGVFFERLRFEAPAVRTAEKVEEMATGSGTEASFVPAPAQLSLSAAGEGVVPLAEAATPAIPAVRPAGLPWARVAGQVGLAFSLIFALYFGLTQAEPMFKYDRQATAKGLAQLQNLVSQAAQKGEVLFIADRHLLTFGYIQGVGLVPDYERVFLMEMAMAGNPDYLGRLHRELQEHRYAMIVSEPLFTQSKGSAEIFGEENDAWVQQVSRYILCSYQSEKLIRDIHVSVFTPREGAQTCP